MSSLNHLSLNVLSKYIWEIHFIFLTSIGVWMQWVACKGRHVNFARDPLRTYFDECHKNEIHILGLHYSGCFPSITVYEDFPAMFVYKVELLRCHYHPITYTRWCKLHVQVNASNCSSRGYELCRKGSFKDCSGNVSIAWFDRFTKRILIHSSNWLKKRQTLCIGLKYTLESSQELFEKLNCRKKIAVIILVKTIDDKNSNWKIQKIIFQKSLVEAYL